MTITTLKVHTPEMLEVGYVPRATDTHYTCMTANLAKGNSNNRLTSRIYPTISQV
jgi:hypothetical protein